MFNKTQKNKTYKNFPGWKTGAMQDICIWTHFIFQFLERLNVWHDKDFCAI